MSFFVSLTQLFVRSRKDYPRITDRLTAHTREPEQVRSLTSLNDTRLALDIYARLRGQPTSALLRELSGGLGFPISPTVSAFQPEILPKELSLFDLFRCGAIPVVHSGIVVGLVTSDPALAQKIHRALGSPPISLSAWSIIEKALQESANLALTAETARAPSEPDRLSQGSEALRLIADQAAQFDQDTFAISISDSEAEFSFYSQARGKASGKINSSLVDALRHILKQKRVRLDAATFVIEKRSGEAGVDAYVLIREASQKKPVDEVAQAQSASEYLSHSVLLVDDNATFLRVVERFFERHQIQSKTAANGDEALELLERAHLKPDAIVCDIHMPKMNGLEFVQRVKALPLGRSTPILMLTSDQSTEAELQALEDGADMFLNKNQDPRLLCAYLKKLISTRKVATQ